MYLQICWLLKLKIKDEKKIVGSRGKSVIVLNDC